MTSDAVAAAAVAVSDDEREVGLYSVELRADAHHADPSADVVVEGEDENGCRFALELKSDEAEALAGEIVSAAELE